MPGLIKELTNYFSLRTSMKSNIISGGYGTIGTSTGLSGSGFKDSQGSIFNSFTSSRQVSTFYQKMEELKDYEITELANTTVSVFHDYLFNHFNEGDDVVSLTDRVPKYQERSKRINNVIKQLNLVRLTKDHFNEIIYYGSYSIKIDWDKKNKKWRRYELTHPYNVVTLLKNGVPDQHLVVTQKGKLASVAPNALIRLGKADFRLVNDVLDIDDKKSHGNLVEEDSIINRLEIVAGTPVFYNLVGKVKEYLLKDQLVSILSIKDLIQPLLLLIRVDKQTDPTEANRLAVNTEELINKYSDLSAIFGSNFSIMDLMDSILNNIRVLPDYQSSLGDMNSIDLSKITQKIQDIKSDQDNSKEAIYASLGIPRALTAGDTTKWEAIKSSQRLNSKLTSTIDLLSDSYVDLVCQIYYLLFNEELDRNEVNIHLFDKTDIDYNDTMTSADIVSQLIRAVNEIVESAQRFCTDSKLIDRREYLNYIKEQLQIIDPKVSEMMTDQMLDKFLKQIEDLEKEQASGGGFGGRSGW